MLPFENRSVDQLPSEEWKDVIDYVGYYKVSSLGRAKSVDIIGPHLWLGFKRVISKNLEACKRTTIF